MGEYDRMHTSGVPRAQPGLFRQDVSTKPPVHPLELTYPGCCCRPKVSAYNHVEWSRGSTVSAGEGALLVSPDISGKGLLFHRAAARLPWYGGPASVHPYCSDGATESCVPDFLNLPSPCDHSEPGKYIAQIEPSTLLSSSQEEDAHIVMY